MKVTLAPAHIGPGSDDTMLTVGVTIGAIEAVIVLLETEALLVQPSIPLMVQLTDVPSIRELVVKVFEFVPTGLPPATQLYIGALPPLVMVAVKVIFVPLQTVPLGLEVILMVGIRIGFTVIVT